MTYLNPRNSSAPPAPLAGLVVIRTTGLSWYDRMYIGVTLLMAAFYYSIFALYIITSFHVSLVVAYLFLTGILLVYFLLGENLQGIRKVLISNRGVAFGYLLHTEFASWSELRMSHSPQVEAERRRGVYFFRSIVTRGRPRRRHNFVTRDQARAILTHPACTIREIEPGVRVYLGL